MDLKVYQKHFSNIPIIPVAQLLKLVDFCLSLIFERFSPYSRFGKGSRILASFINSHDKTAYSLFHHKDTKQFPLIYSNK